MGQLITSWTYGVNSLKQFRYGTLYLREEPWWLALCGWAIDMSGYGCRWLHWIKMPRFIKITDKDDGEVMSWCDYYGDLGTAYHLKIYNPLFQWHATHPRSKTFNFEVGYDKLKEIFGERDAKLFSQQEELDTLAPHTMEDAFGKD